MEDFKRWIEQAKRDIKIAEYNCNGDFFESSIFYCQQSVEKSLKAILIKNEGKLLKIHDLVILGRKTNLPNEFLKIISELNSAYTKARYGISINKIPAELFSKTETLDFLNLAKEILKWAENQM